MPLVSKEKKEKNRLYMKAWRAKHLGYTNQFYYKHREKHLEQRKAYRQKIKTEVLTYYSGEEPTCKMCNEKRLACLSIDHINGKGAEHRKQLGVSGLGLYCWLIKNNYPNGFQVLCMNCQFIKRANNHETRGNSIRKTYT